MHPLFDAKKLTDDELYDKIAKAYQYRAYQASLGHDPTVGSIEQIITVLEDEKLQRLNKSIAEETEKKNPNYLDPINIGYTEEVEEEDDENKQ